MVFNVAYGIKCLQARICGEATEVMTLPLLSASKAPPPPPSPGELLPCMTHGLNLSSSRSTLWVLDYEVNSMHGTLVPREVMTSSLLPLGITHPFIYSSSFVYFFPVTHHSCSFFILCPLLSWVPGIPLHLSFLTNLMILFFTLIFFTLSL